MPTFLMWFTIVHVAISLVAIGSGFVVILDLVRSKESHRWTVLFLMMTVLTSVTGFGFPVDRIMPSHVFGVLSLLALGIAIYGRYSRSLMGNWRVLYVVSAILAQYLNVFVLIVQSFQKIPALHVLAPTQSELPFVGTQLISLIAFIYVGILAVQKFHLFQTVDLQNVTP